MPISLRKCTIWIGSPITFLYPKRIKIEGCVLIIPILIRHAKKIPSSSPRSIMLWTLRSIAAF
jgi:hypothetical protein